MWGLVRSGGQENVEGREREDVIAWLRRGEHPGKNSASEISIRNGDHRRMPSSLCAKKVLENTGFKPVSYNLEDFGFKKGKPK